MEVFIHLALCGVEFAFDDINTEDRRVASLRYVTLHWFK